MNDDWDLNIVGDASISNVVALNLKRQSLSGLGGKEAMDNALATIKRKNLGELRKVTENL